MESVKHEDSMTAAAVYNGTMQSDPLISQGQTMIAAPTVVASIVQELSNYSNEELADKLPNININFTCKVCSAKKPSLKELIEHLSEGGCQKKRPRGRPKKVPLASGEEPPAKAGKKVKLLESKASPARPFRHTTRMSTGSIQRKNAAEMLGLCVKSEPMDDVDDEDDATGDVNDAWFEYVMPPEEQKPEVMQQGIIEQNRNFMSVQETSEEMMSHTQPADTSQPEQQQVLNGNQSVTKHPQLSSLNPLADSNNIEFVSLPASNKLNPEPSKATKVSLIPQTIVDLQSAKARGQKTQPVVTIKSEDHKGSIVIPTANDSGKKKEMIIPHSLLLEALNEHKKRNAQAMAVENHDPQRESAVSQLEDEVDDPATDEPCDAEAGGQIEDVDGNADADDFEPNQEHKVKSSTRTTGRNRFSTLLHVDRPFRCNLCIVRYFASKLELKVHMDSHVYKGSQSAAGKSLCSIRDSFKCVEPGCGFKIANWNRMIRHLICHERIKDMLKDTVSVRNILGAFQCPVCKKRFGVKASMVSHLRTVHRKTPKTCEVCAKTMNNVDDKTFRRHVEKCRNVIMQCELCPYKTAVTVNMKKHMRTHSETAYHCYICGKNFGTKQRLKVHMVCHEANRQRLPCEQCGMLFLTADALKKHTNRMHSQIEQHFPCDKCAYIGKIETDLKKHKKLVHQKRFMCQEENCDFMTNSEPVFQVHGEYHRPECICACHVPNCYYRGVSNAHLTEHCAKVHNSGAKHQCPVCQKHFKKKTHLLRHLVTHTGDRPYTCADCNESFYSHSTYYRHRSKTGHSGRKEGVASIPQNIVIRYVQEGIEGKRDVMLDYHIGRKDSTEPAAVDHQVGDSFDQQENQPFDVDIPTDLAGAVNPDVVNSLDSIEPVDAMIAAADVPRQDEVVFIETSEAQFLQEININDITGGHQGDLLQPTDIETMHNSQMLENIVTIPEGQDGQEYTYILSAEEAESMISTGQFTVDVPETPTGVNIGDSLLDMAPTEEQIQQEIVYRTGTSLTGMETVVEVTPPGGSQQYAILLVPSEGDEPDAAISMLQLQSSL